jgi:hypothetical protein
MIYFIAELFEALIDAIFVDRAIRADRKRRGES